MNIIPDTPAVPVFDALAKYVFAESLIYRCPSDPMVYERCAAASPLGRGISYFYCAGRSGCVGSR